MLEQFTDQYKVSKTLRFELIPVGKTLEHIESRGIIESDEDIAESLRSMTIGDSLIFIFLPRSNMPISVSSTVRLAIRVIN